MGKHVLRSWLCMNSCSQIAMWEPLWAPAMCQASVLSGSFPPAWLSQWHCHPSHCCPLSKQLNVKCKQSSPFSISFLSHFRIHKPSPGSLKNSFGACNKGGKLASLSSHHLNTQKSYTLCRIVQWKLQNYYFLSVLHLISLSGLIYIVKNLNLISSLK